MVDAHVLYVLPVLQPAGAERIVASLALRLREHGFGTSVVCLEDETAPVGVELSAAGIPVRGLHLSRRRTLACSSALLRALPNERPLIVHAHLFHANLAARAAFSRMDRAAREGVHVLSTVHVVERRFRPWQFALDRLSARHCRAEICVSRAVARFQQRKTGLPEEFFRVIENGIDLSRFTPASRGVGPASVPADPLPSPLWGEGGASAPGEGAALTPESPATPTGAAPARVVSVGRLDPQKDFATLLRAWKSVQARHSAAELCIAGDGPEAGALKSLAAAEKLERVNFLGYVEDIPALLRSASLYVQPSAWEGFGLSVAEAMSCALPVVVTDADSLPELVAHERTGLVVPKGRPAELAGALLALLDDPHRAAQFGAAARREALARFSVERMAGEYAKLYKELLH